MGKVLLVDDHPDIVRLLQIALQPQGHAILTAYNGAQALELIQSEHPDLVVLDVMMPEVDGLRVLNRIKTSPELQDIVVVMLTVRDQPEDVTLGLDVGADYYLTKPFKPDEIAALVRRVFSNR
jgi:two-component system, OmpR family, alkaline phosphatase synthesis response regulator PhoP